MPRPLLPADKKKDHARSVYFYHEEFYQVARKAIRADMHVSEYIRQAVIEKMEKESSHAV